MLVLCDSPTGSCFSLQLNSTTLFFLFLIFFLSLLALLSLLLFPPCPRAQTSSASIYYDRLRDYRDVAFKVTLQKASTSDTVDSAGRPSLGQEEVLLSNNVRWHKMRARRCLGCCPSSSLTRVDYVHERPSTPGRGQRHAEPCGRLFALWLWTLHRTDFCDHAQRAPDDGLRLVSWRPGGKDVPFPICWLVATISHLLFGPPFDLTPTACARGNSDLVIRNKFEQECPLGYEPQRAQGNDTFRKPYDRGSFCSL